jgi:hypothetical protein
MTKQELKDVINKYCKINDISSQYDGYLYHIINELNDHEAPDLQLVVGVDKRVKCIITVVPVHYNLYTQTRYRRIPILKILRNDLLSELLN